MLMVEQLQVEQEEVGVGVGEEVVFLREDSVVHIQLVLRMTYIHCSDPHMDKLFSAKNVNNGISKNVYI